MKTIIKICLAVLVTGICAFAQQPTPQPVPVPTPTPAPNQFVTFTASGSLILSCYSFSGSGQVPAFNTVKNYTATPIVSGGSNTGNYNVSIQFTGT